MEKRIQPGIYEQVINEDFAKKELKAYRDFWKTNKHKYKKKKV